MPKSRLRRQITEAESPDIIVYPRRRTLVAWIWLYGIPALFGCLFALGILLLLIVTPGMSEQIGAVLALICMMGGLGALGAWPMFGLIRFLRSGEPVLVINHAGISVRGVYTSRAIFLSWEEVKSVRGGPVAPYPLLIVQPVTDATLFPRLSLLTRLAYRLHLLSGEPLALSQSVLDQPVAEILAQVQKQYKKELQLHQEHSQVRAQFSAENGKQELVLYTSRWHLLAPAFFFVMAVVPGSILIFIGPRQLSGALISLCFLVGGIAAGVIQTWSILRLPVLVVDDEGIACPRLRRHAKLKWEEMDAVYGDLAGTHLLIDASPSGITPFLARQHKEGRLVIPRYMDITIPQTVFTVPRQWLPLSLDQLLEQIKARFQDQLERYKIATAIDEP